MPHINSVICYFGSGNRNYIGSNVGTNAQMSGSKDSGTNPKNCQRKWSFLAPSGARKKEPKPSRVEEVNIEDNYRQSIQNEVKRLEETNKKYEDDYINERKIMPFNLSKNSTY